MTPENETARAMNSGRLDGFGGINTEPVPSPLGLVDTKYILPPVVVKTPFSADRLASFRRFQLRAVKLTGLDPKTHGEVRCSRTPSRPVPSSSWRWLHWFPSRVAKDLMTEKGVRVWAKAVHG